MAESVVEGTSTAPTMQWHTLRPSEALRNLDTDPRLGLSSEEAKKRLDRFGPNLLREEKSEPFWQIFVEELREPLILLLVGVAVLYAIMGEFTDAAMIFAIIILLITSEVLNERRATRAIAALHKLAEPTATALRDGGYIQVPTENVVPGDLLVLEAGHAVPADARLLESNSLAANESALTGEAVPIEKDADVVLAAAIPLAERRTLVFSGTVISRGRGSAVVVATGARTELGRVAQLTGEVESPPTPLQSTMRELSRWLVWVAIGVSVLVPLLGWLIAGQSPQQMLLTGLSLIFAITPEELPIILTMVVALGALRLARQNVIVKRLTAVETLGSVTVIATDKTGTLTENRMQVARLEPPDNAYRQELLKVGALANDAVPAKDGEFLGDPVDTALLRAAEAEGMQVPFLRGVHALRAEFSFDNARKRMSCVFEREHPPVTQGEPAVPEQEPGSGPAGQRELWSEVKGAPEAILSLSTRQWTPDGDQPMNDAQRQRWLERAAGMSGDGLRVIALAEKRLTADAHTSGHRQDGTLSQEIAESDLALVGLAGFADPPRPDVKEAIAECRGAGIRTVMVTGDHPLTARAVAGEVGLDISGGMLSGADLDAMPDSDLQKAVEQVSVFARTTPEHKLRIVNALHERGERVAVTGDGINDGPALAAADIGVAMGETGTDVAREAADMVLADDNFASITRAVREGRGLFANLRKGVRYYLACKMALASAILLPVLLLVPVPLLPIQIILTEMFMDLAASAAFVVEPPESDLMRQPPRSPKEPFMNAGMVASILISAAGLFAAVAVTYLTAYYRGVPLGEARTVGFVAWLLGHVFLAINMRSEREPLLRIGIFSNPWMLAWAAATILFVLLVTFVPWVQVVLHTTALTGQEWALVLVASVAGTFWMEIAKWIGHGFAAWPASQQASPSST